MGYIPNDLSHGHTKLRWAGNPSILFSYDIDFKKIENLEKNKETLLKLLTYFTVISIVTVRTQTLIRWYTRTSIKTTTGTGNWKKGKDKW